MARRDDSRRRTRGKSPETGGAASGGGLLDLPLGPGAVEDLPTRPASPGPQVVDQAPPARPPRRPRPRRRRRKAGGRFPVLPVLLLVAVAVGAYLLLRPKPPKPVFTPAEVEFGERRVGAEDATQAVTVANAGERSLTVSGLALIGPAAAEFSLDEGTCAGASLDPGAECALELAFAPAGIGPREAELELTTAELRAPVRAPVLGTGVAPRLAVEPAELVFAPTEVAATSQPAPVTVTNSGTAPLRIEGVGVEGGAARDFDRRGDRCSAATLAPGDRCTIELVFSPRAAGERRAELAFRSDAFGEAPQVVLEGVGVWSGAAFDVAPLSLDFGDQLLGKASAKQTVRVTNRRAAALGEVAARLADRRRGFEVTADGCTGTLAGGGSCSVDVVFTPRVEGSLQTALQIVHPVAGEIEVPLTGRGVQPRLVLDVTSLEFGEARAGGPGGGETEPRQVRLENRGSAAATIRRVAIGGQDDDGFTTSRDRCRGQELAPGGSCTVEVAFRPRREGAHRAELLLSPEPAGGEQRVRLTGTSVAARLVVDRESLDFGQVRRTTAAELRLALANRGTAALRLGRLALRGEGAADFALAGGSCQPEGVLAPGGGCEMVVRFAPTAEGRRTAALAFDHDALSGPREIPLGGSGLPPPVPAIRAEPGRLDFGPQPVGDRSAILTITLSNPGTGRLELRDFRLRGDHAGDFLIVPATCQAAPYLVPGSDCTLGLRFQPAAAGPRRATLEIRHNAGSGDTYLELRGSGLGG